MARVQTPRVFALRGTVMAVLRIGKNDPLQQPKDNPCPLSLSLPLVVLKKKV